MKRSILSLITDGPFATKHGLDRWWELVDLGWSFIFLRPVERVGWTLKWCLEMVLAIFLTPLALLGRFIEHRHWTHICQEHDEAMDQ